jgi:hypothetical protein
MSSFNYYKSDAFVCLFTVLRSAQELMRVQKGEDDDVGGVWVGKSPVVLIIF